MSSFLNPGFLLLLFIIHVEAMKVWPAPPTEGRAATIELTEINPPVNVVVQSQQQVANLKPTRSKSWSTAQEAGLFTMSKSSEEMLNLVATYLNTAFSLTQIGLSYYIESQQTARDETLCKLEIINDMHYDVRSISVELLEDKSHLVDVPMYIEAKTRVPISLFATEGNGFIWADIVLLIGEQHVYLQIFNDPKAKKYQQDPHTAVKIKRKRFAFRWALSPLPRDLRYEDELSFILAAVAQKSTDWNHFVPGTGLTLKRDLYSFSIEAMGLIFEIWADPDSNEGTFTLKISEEDNSLKEGIFTWELNNTRLVPVAPNDLVFNNGDSAYKWKLTLIYDSIFVIQNLYTLEYLTLDRSDPSGITWSKIQNPNIVSNRDIYLWTILPVSQEGYYAFLASDGRMLATLNDMTTGVQLYEKQELFVMLNLCTDFKLNKVDP